MAPTLNHITHGNRIITSPVGGGDYAISFVDYFVDGRSFETRLREDFPDLYSRGRYRETQVPTLAGGLDDPAQLQEAIDNIAAI
jgi:hypothetical protein